MTSRSQEENLSVFSIPWVSEMYILATLLRGDSYGYAIVKSNSIGMSESATYPILRRLEKAGCLESYSQISDSKLRKCYKITAVGRERLTKYKDQWRGLAVSVETILSGQSK